MKTVNFPDVVVFLEGPGVRNWQFRESGIKLINIRNLVDDNIDLLNTSNFLDLNEANEKYKHFLLCEGEFVMASSGVTWGKIAEIKKEHLPLCLNTSIIKLVPKSPLTLEKRFLWHFIKSFSFRRQIDRLITGSAQPNFGPSHLEQIQIPLPPLATQKKIAAILDAADEYRQKTKTLIEKYDQLAQSVFLEMFGDPVRNEKGWKLIKLGQLGEWRSGGTPSRKIGEYYNGKIPWLSSGELETIYITDSIEHITERAVMESAAKKIEPGSLLLGMYDTAALKSSITIGQLTCNQAIAFCRLNDELVNTIFVYHVIQYGKDHFRRLQRGVRQKNMNLTMIKDILIFCPPIALQTQFAERIQLIEAQKQQVQASLQKAEDLFNSLLQRAFKGELVE